MKNKNFEEKLPAFDAAEVRSRGDFLATGTSTENLL